MSTWDDVKKSIRTVANKVVVKTDELADDAAQAIRKKTTEAHLCESYEQLGRVSYRILCEEQGSLEELLQDADFITAKQQVESLQKTLEEHEKKQSRA